MKEFNTAAELIEAGIVGSKPSLYRLVKEDGFPPPIKIGKRRSAWRAAEVAEWVNNRPRLNTPAEAA
ncbi:MAG: AlpA family phage regulatory protein [Alphaproteobacteria bacterium]|nr:AlpA family phage regulatory protein [Alphaproteobacteria bacterium]MBU0798649.1 AlpA family phage regulatory protein [Alphaproteobacteria bacterium]MBU0885912.1 AlpA family phage regulatory protein [Alphaproteobacteria bacterium]MBU1811901.1 AlpA family phage regulatory protein [Alphaproteobacteria bacterium]